jgi:hypothetical protein
LPGAVGAVVGALVSANVVGTLVGFLLIGAVGRVGVREVGDPEGAAVVPARSRSDTKRTRSTKNTQERRGLLSEHVRVREDEGQGLMSNGSTEFSRMTVIESHKIIIIFSNFDFWRN